MTNFSKLGDWFWCDYDKIDSTNNELKKLVLLSGEKNKIIITAKEQTAGKGRLDHQWISLMGNLFMSLGINWNLQNIGILSLISALALYKTIKIYSPTKEILLKWPNDVFIDRKKVSGILIESVSSSFAIIGILCYNPPYTTLRRRLHGLVGDWTEAAAGGGRGLYHRCGA